MKSVVVLTWTVLSSTVILTNAAFNQVAEANDFESTTGDSSSSTDRDEMDSSSTITGRGSQVTKGDNSAATSSASNLSPSINLSEVTYSSNNINGSNHDGDQTQNTSSSSGNSPKQPKQSGNILKQDLDNDVADLSLFSNENNKEESEDYFVKEDNDVETPSSLLSEYTDHHGHWGTPPTSATIPNTATSATATATTATSNNDQSSTLIGGTPHTFLSKTTDTARNIIRPASQNHNHNVLQHIPPEAFTLTALIQRKGSRSFFLTTPTATTSTTTTLAKNKDIIPSSIPYLECNSIGTTTPPIPTSNLSFRSFPKSAHPSSFTYTRGFIVPLSKIEIEVKSDDQGHGKIPHHYNGDDNVNHKNEHTDHVQTDTSSHNHYKRIFSPGDVIWVDGEYRMTSAQESDLSVLIINVPNNKRKDKSRDLFGISKIHCHSDQDNVENQIVGEEDMVMENHARRKWIQIRNRLLRWKEKDLVVADRGMISLQKVLLTVLGVGLSSLMTFFWIKVAPLQLAVGIGGLCMVGGGTLGIVMLGEMICDEFGEYLEKVRQERMLVVEQEEEEGEEEATKEQSLHT